MYKAVFLDLDGTLLDDKKIISEEDKDAIKYVREKGGMVFIASGRPIASTQKYFDKIDADKFIVYSNGAGIYDTEARENLFSARIDKRICLDLNRFAKENNICIRVDTPYGRYISDEKFALSLDVIDKNIDAVIRENDILQVSILSETEEPRAEAIEYINENIRSGIKIENVFMTGYNNEFFAINIVNTSASKGNAIQGLCKYLKINIEDVIAIGDGANDISMIEAAGLGVAMLNAEEDVKDIADEITLENNNNSGVGKLLKSKFLIKRKGFFLKSKGSLNGSP